MGWREVIVFAQQPSFEVALAAARMRFLARLRNAPATLFGLLLVQIGVRRWRVTYATCGPFSRLCTKGRTYMANPSRGLLDNRNHTLTNGFRFPWLPFGGDELQAPYRSE